MVYCPCSISPGGRTRLRGIGGRRDSGAFPQRRTFHANSGTPLLPLTSAGMMEWVDMLDLGTVTSVKNYCSISGARDP